MTFYARSSLYSCNVIIIRDLALLTTQKHEQKAAVHLFLKARSILVGYKNLILFIPLSSELMSNIFTAFHLDLRLFTLTSHNWPWSLARRKKSKTKKKLGQERLSYHIHTKNDLPFVLTLPFVLSISVKYQ